MDRGSGEIAGVPFVLDRPALHYPPNLRAPAKTVPPESWRRLYQKALLREGTVFCGAEQVDMQTGIRYAALSDQGRRGRNEDALFAGQIGEYHVFAVADGLGGHARGDVASACAVDVLGETVAGAGSHADPAELLRTAFERANTEIFAYNRRERLNAGTTLSAALVDSQGRCRIASVGDSRVYVISGDAVWHTRDHSYVQELVDTGLIGPEEAMTHPGRNILTRALGLHESVQVALYEKDVGGSVLLVSSDGLHDYVHESRIRAIVTVHEPLEACRSLIEAAKEGASTDNMSVVVVRF